MTGGQRMRLSSEAMVVALEDFLQLKYSTQLASLYESFLVSHWLQAHGHYPNPTVADANEAVAEIFALFPDHSLGRLAPFRFDWKVTDDSGRKTVWNNTTRGETLATSILNAGTRGHGDLRQGLVPGAATIVQNELSDRPLPSWQSLVCLLLSHYDFALTDDWHSAKQIMLNALGLSSADLGKVTANHSLGPPLLGTTEWTSFDLPDHLVPPSPIGDPSYRTSAGIDLAVAVDNRVQSMLKRAVTSHACILLVGPPGTGKGTLLRWLIDRIAENPADFGFSSDLAPNPVWRTPDESWSSLELVGGLVPDPAGQLRWSNGLVINAIAEQRWLILDETNRADMDKIMGPLLTWLSEQEVEVGRSTSHEGAPIILGWTDSQRSASEDPQGMGQPTRFLAGRDWRLFGTYNPQDAQRVFRFGLALSRRFAVVPIPAIAPGQFEQLLTTRHTELSPDAVGAVSGLYSQHYDSPSTLLGPAVFLRMADYIARTDQNIVLEDIVAEAYVISLGQYLITYDDQTFDQLGNRVRDATSLTSAHWAWIKAQRHLLS